MRASFLVVGPLLARFGQVDAPHPGGCAIGSRPVSVDLKAFQTMGADVQVGEDYYVIKSPRLQGRRIMLDYPSHTGTENVLMAACLADGTTLIENASIEPEVSDLAGFLCAMGARIHGAGTNVIQVDGVRKLHGAAYRVMPDRMEAGTFALAGATSGGEVSMEGAVSQWMVALTSKLREAGAEVTAETGIYSVKAPGPLRAADIQTYPYPGFPTDLQAPFTAVMTQAQGNSSIHETMFEDRLRYVSELRRMGAVIDLFGSGRTAVVHGPASLVGTQVTALDIRSGAAVVLAGLAAEGVTEVGNVGYIDRGYEDLVGKLQALGARITLREEPAREYAVDSREEPVEWGVVPYGVGAGG
jgi:UDP-N-acetylglucosamine 1-carboxyvinyltransferase